MKVQRGYIYRIAYREYKHDPFPLILVLYADEDKVHALNLNYLSNRLTNQVINMITDVATKRISGDNAYGFYHRHLKRFLPVVIKYCYRTYFTSKITSPKKISEGFYQTRGILGKLKSFYSDQEYNDIKKKIKQSIKDANNPETEKKQVKRMFRLFKENEKLSPKELEERVRKYFDHVNDIKIKNPKIDWSEFTFNR